jgi:predicted unusual protein kinase regulating ubiquinone biosynthesis (AarF/ABC1/UbiB family)
MLRKRYRKILLFFFRVILKMAIFDVVFPHIGLNKLSKRGRSRRIVNAARQYRLLAVQMGGVMIKVGQFLSARVDMLPVEVTDELSDLQDQVPPEDFRHIRQLTERELGESLESAFDMFEEEPLASASLGQVHRAVLKDEDVLKTEAEDIKFVVVKVQRESIDAIIDVDLSAFRRVTKWLQRYKPIRKRVDLAALMEEFSTILGQEIDYLNEGQNAERFWDIYQGRSGIKIPRVIWGKTTRRVLTLEDVYAIKITNYQEISSAGVDLPGVAKRLFSCYMEQIFDKGFFHADPHPGNLFVIPPDQSATDEWQLAFVDFGMVGQVPESAMDGLREAMIAVGTQDPGRMVKAYQKLDVLLPGADLELIEKAETRVFERFWGKSMAELRDFDPREFMEFGEEFRDLMYDMPFQVPQDLLLLGRAVAILSGMCTGLDPGFNVWDNIRPYAEELVKSELTDNLEGWWGEIELILRSLVALPNRMDRFLNSAERGELQVQAPSLQRELKVISNNLRAITRSLVFLALFVGGIQLLLASYIPAGYLLLGLSIIPLILLIIR